MYSNKNRLGFFLILFTVFTFSCENLEEININPNGIIPEITHPNFLLSTNIVRTGKAVVDMGYGDIAGVMQHTQKDGWSGGHNAYEWTPNQDWGGYYSTLRNIDEMYTKSVDLELDFHLGVGLILKSYNFGLITDLWGDAPYSKALYGDLGGEENIKPVFDSQQEIYAGILADLDTANTLLSKDQNDYIGIDAAQDVLFGGDVTKWRKFANSLALRYYMRLSEKDPVTAKAGIEKIVDNPDEYPIILEASDDASMKYPGSSAIDAWPKNIVYDGTAGSNFRRLKMCATIVDTLQALSDPRLTIWAARIEIPIVVVATPVDRDEIVDGIRYIGQDIVDVYVANLGFPIDEDTDYIGLPASWSIIPQAYNMNPNGEQAPYNPHASHLNDIYKSPSGDLLFSRMLSAAEVHFIIAEAALKGWTGESSQSHYEAGVEASFDAWGVSGDYAAYIAGPRVAYDGTLAQIMEQKWIASWTAAAEAWFDYRRTGLPALKHGVFVKREALPLRFYYSVSEIDYNPVNSSSAIELLEETEFSTIDGKNSAWSKMWVLQGTGKPY